MRHTFWSERVLLRTLTTCVFVLGLALNVGASAQYLDSPQPGYLPAASRGPAVDSPLFSDAGPVFTLGAALDLGMSRFDTGGVDRQFFAVNSAHELGGTTTLDVGFEGWLQLHRHLRLGFDTAFGDGGDGIATSRLSGGGLLIEGGGALGNTGWSLWGGAVLGRARVVLRTEDEPGNFYEYEGRFNRVEIQGHAEVVVAPLVALRGTVGLSRGWLVADTITTGVLDTSDVEAVRPADTQMDLTAGSVMFGIVLGF